MKRVLKIGIIAIVLSVFIYFIISGLFADINTEISNGDAENIGYEYIMKLEDYDASDPYKITSNYPYTHLYFVVSYTEYEITYENSKETIVIRVDGQLKEVEIISRNNK